MGNLQAQDMVAQLAWLGSDNLNQAISWHLTSNHFPPIGPEMVPICVEAIDNANDGELDKMVQLPDGVGYKGRTAAPTRAIIEQHHLESFLD